MWSCVDSLEPRLLLCNIYTVIDLQHECVLYVSFVSFNKCLVTYTRHLWKNVGRETSMCFILFHFGEVSSFIYVCCYLILWSTKYMMWNSNPVGFFFLRCYNCSFSSRFRSCIHPTMYKVWSCGHQFICRTTHHVQALRTYL